jgi:DNA mismatch repair protein MutS
MFQKSPDWIKDRIVALDLDRMTPMAALQALHSIKEDIIEKESAHSGESGRKVSSSRKR